MKWTRAIGLAPAIVLLANAARAVPPPSLRMVGDEAACPTPRQIVAVLDRLLPRTKVSIGVGPPGPEDASIADEGPHYHVTVAGQQRTFADGARKCAERARHAAVFVALILDPPIVPERAADEPPPVPPPRPPPPPVERPPAPIRSVESSPWLDLTLGAVFQVAPAMANRRTAMAGGVAAWARAKRGFHVALGAGLLSGSLHFDAAEASAWWIPIDVAAGYTFKADQWEVGAQIGPSASVLSIIGQNLEEAQRRFRLEVGGRAAAFSRFWFNSKFALLLSADAVVRPLPYVLQVDPQGDVGSMPAMWFGGCAGLTGEIE